MNGSADCRQGMEDIFLWLKNTIFHTICSTTFHSFIFVKMASGDYRVADISLADFGRKEIELAEHEVIIYNQLWLAESLLT